MHDWEGLGATQVAVTLTLREAATRLNELGWTQGKFRDETTGAVDAVQAIASVLGVELSSACRKGTRLPVGATVLLGAALERVTAHVGTRYLSVWNDLPERTADDVVHALEEA